MPPPPVTVLLPEKVLLRAIRVELVLAMPPPQLALLPEKVLFERVRVEEWSLWIAPPPLGTLLLMKVLLKSKPCCRRS